MPSILCEHVRFDTSRCYTVDSDTTLSKVGSKGLDESDNRHLTSIVESVVFDAQKAGSNGAHEDDAAVVLDVLVGGLADEELRAGIQVEDVIILLLCDFLGDVPALGAGVGHDDVDLAEGLLAFLEETGDF